MNKYIGVDVGGTSAKIGIVNSNGIIEKRSVFVRKDSDSYLKDICESIKKLITENDLDGQIKSIGFASPGFIDHEKGIVVISGNLGLKNFNLKKEIKKYFPDIDIKILNDANAAALGEHWMGASAEYTSTIFYTLGTGIGGAVVLDGKLVTGKNGFAGEFGHGGFMQDEKDCTCGLKYCLEAKSSPINISNHLIEEIKTDKKLQSFFKDFKDKITFADIIGVYRKNKKPIEIKNYLINRFKPLISHMSLMIMALDVDSIVIGGGASSMGDDLIEIIQSQLNKIVLDAYKDNVAINIATLGNDAGIIGAAYYTMNE